MKHSMEFELAWQGMKLGIHEFNYEVDKHFMAAHGDDEAVDYNDIHANVGLKFEKHENFFLLHFDIDGKMLVPCDRCGDEFELKLWDEFDLLIKLVESAEEDEREEDADVVFVPRSETVIDISKWIYEFVMLSIPLQRIHPDKPDGSSGCNQEALRLLGTLTDTEAKTNNIWEGLKGLKLKQDNPKRK